MDRVVDLDQAAAEITARLPAWTTSGLLPGPITWRDGAAPWPQPLETDRALVADPAPRRCELRWKPWPP